MYLCIRSDRGSARLTVSPMEAVNERPQKMLRCKASTDATKLAGSIYSTCQENAGSDVVVRVIGAGALNQAVKASIISNKYFAKKVLKVLLQPSFKDAGEVGTMTAIELTVVLAKL